MSRPGKPGRFRVSQPAPVAAAAQKVLSASRFRDSPAERGYDHRWDGISRKFRQLNPFCVLCEQQGRDTLTEVTDHMIPVQDRPDLVHDWGNLAPMCIRHNNEKKAWEAYARARGLLDLLPLWVKDPESRPPQFRCLEIR